MLRARVLKIFTWVDQFNLGVKKTPRYRMNAAGLMTTSVPCGSSKLIVGGGLLCFSTCFRVGFG